MSAAREEILRRVRDALANGDREGDGPEPPPIPRAYRRAGTLPSPAAVALFAERCAEYRARVRRVPAGSLPEALRAALDGAARVAIPADVPSDWRVPGPEWIDDDALDARALDGVDAVLTGCAVAVAESGTIALDHGAAQGRRALTLVPDHHVCVVREDQVVELLPEALAHLAEAAREGRPITLVAGPSATSDIELTRVEGVHGPRRLDVLLVG